MNRHEAIEQAAQVVADKPYSTLDGRKFFCLYETVIIDDLRNALALPKDTTEREALVKRIDAWWLLGNAHEDASKLLRDIRRHLMGESNGNP